MEPQKGQKEVEIMVRRSGFLSATIQMAKAIEAEQSAQAAAIREQNALARHQQKLQREYERAEKQAEKEKAIQYAIDKTNESETIRSKLSSILKQSKQKPIRFNWNQFKKYEPFPDPEPEEPNYISYPNEINPAEYKPEIGFFDKIFKKKKHKKIEDYEARLQRAIDFRNKKIIEIQVTNENLKNIYKELYNTWLIKKNKFEDEQNEHNTEIDKQEIAFNNNQQEIIELYFNTILSSINLPEALMTSWIISYEPISQILIIDYDLPNKNIIPKLKIMKYVITRKEFSKTITQNFWPRSSSIKIYNGIAQNGFPIYPFDRNYFFILFLNYFDKIKFFGMKMADLNVYMYMGRKERRSFQSDSE